MARGSARRRILPWVVAAIALDAALWLVGPPDTFDQRFSYPVASVADYFEFLGEAGRRRYALTECIDLGFIAVYSTLAWRVWTAMLGQSRWRWTTVTLGVLDLIETGAILVGLFAHPRPLPGVAQLQSLATPCKWVAAATLVSATITIGVATAVRARRSASSS